MGISTRSGRTIGSPLSPSNHDLGRQSRSPRPKRTPRSTKASKKGTPVIDQPLSVLTQDYKIAVRDMGAWVRRPLADRQEEARNRKDKRIPRPMNSFMLYRSAYAERVKQFCKETNHQLVSQVTGASWPLEPKEIRDMYEQYAILERDNHQLAHPDYKFAPNKDGKRRIQVEDDSDSDPEWEGSTRSAKRSRTGRRDDNRSHSSTPFEDRRYVVSQYPSPALNPSSYQAINPYGPAPMMIGPDGMTGQYYQTTVTPYSQQIDDVRFGKVEHAFPQYDMTQSLVGMPSGSHDLLSGPPISNAAASVQVGIVDPRLAQLDANYQYVQYDGVEQAYEIPRTYEYSSYAPQPVVPYQQEAFHPGLATLTDGHNIWSEQQAGSDFDSEFQKWQ